MLLNATTLKIVAYILNRPVYNIYIPVYTIHMYVIAIKYSWRHFAIDGPMKLVAVNADKTCD